MLNMEGFLRSSFLLRLVALVFLLLPQGVQRAEFICPFTAPISHHLLLANLWDDVLSQSVFVYVCKF